MIERRGPVYVPVCDGCGAELEEEYDFRDAVAVLKAPDGGQSPPTGCTPTSALPVRGGVTLSARPDTTLEKDIERKLRELIEKRGGCCLKWVCPGWSGVPDRIILLPRGRVMFVETKRPRGGKLSKLQEWWMDKLRELGFTVMVVWNEHDLRFLELLIITKEEDYGY